jgi:DNA-binding response OmpR family regulator
VQQLKRRAATNKDGPVLIVDDSPDLRSLIAELLAIEGYEAVEAADGAEALRLIDGGLRPQVILLDRNTPLLSGPQFLQAASGLLHGIAVILVTGADCDVSHPSLVATLHKPFEIDVLVRLVQDHARRGVRPSTGETVSSNLDSY